MPIDSDVQGPTWSPEGDRLLINTWSPGELGRPGILAPDGSSSHRSTRRASPISSSASTGRPTVPPWCARSTPTRSQTSMASTCSGSMISSWDASPRVRTTTRIGSAGECGGGDGRAMYSPDGTTIAFVRQKCGTGANPSADESAAIVLMNPDGTDQRELVEQGKVKSHPGWQISWSPDSTSIAFGSQDGDLFLVDVATGSVTPIPLPTDVGSHHADGPDWSPDGIAAGVLDVHGCPEVRRSSTRSLPMAATSGRSRRVEVRSTAPAGDRLPAIRRSSTCRGHGRRRSRHRRPG